MNNVTVYYTLKHIDKSSMLYGYLIDHKKQFGDFKDAVTFARKIDGLTKNGVSVYGRPVIEENEMKEAG